MTRTEFQLDRAFDMTVQAEGSNQTRTTGTFVMQVRRVLIQGFRRMGEWEYWLGVDGYRYKADGFVSERSAYARVNLRELPSDVQDAIRHYYRLPKELLK